MMTESHFEGGDRITAVLVLIFLLVVVGGTVDLVLDRPATLLSLHVAFEVLMVAVSLGAAAYLARGWYAAQSSLAESRRISSELRDEKETWQRRSAEVLRGLGAAISTQFDSWELTPTERRVALMLLKGLSHKRIAKMTETSERTVRQHSVAVYRKSGLGGRAELAGFFLESLLLPEEEDGARDDASRTGVGS